MARRPREAPEAAIIRLERDGVLGASAWFSDSDPFMAMAFDPARFTTQQATKKFLATLRRDVRDQWRGGDYDMTLAEFHDDVAWSGVYLMGFEDMIPRNVHERHDAVERLLGLGWTFVPTP